ncbi:Uncharacterised protein [Mycobacterium tuberculosis]|nr:Uncharacterised protein [Mycobacterium tuberculosis]
MMHGNGSFLCVYASSEHTRRTEQYTDFALVHPVDKVFTLLVIFRLLNKPYFVCRYAVVFYEFAFNFGVHIPFAWLVSSQIRKNKLSSFL